ncbi:unnamed protein product, partial [Staurois parvus]
QSLSWVPVRPPIAAVSIATLCHVPLSGLLTHCWVPFCHKVLADYRPPIGAARPQICHGPPYRLVTLLLAHSVTWVPVPPPIAPTLPCATFRSPHTPAGFHLS